jgi:hypothetical protein
MKGYFWHKTLNRVEFGDFYLYLMPNIYQSLVDSMVICAELGREDHGLIPDNCDQKGDETT